MCSDRQENLAVEKVVGYDLVADYPLGLGTWGHLDIRNVLSLINKWEQQEIAGQAGQVLRPIARDPKIPVQYPRTL